MGNTILKPSIIAKEALMVLRNNAIMANLVHRDYSDEFVAGVGNTISIKKPAQFEAKEFTNAIEVQDAKEDKIDVKMDKHLDVSFAVTSEELTLDIENFSKQFLVPAMQAFADKIDKYLIGLEADITSRVPHDAEKIGPADIVAARKFLTDNAVPSTERRLVIGSQADADLLTNELFVSAEKVGDAGTALKEASLGRKFGFDIYTDQNIVKTGDSYTPSIAFHKNAFAFVTRPLALPKGAQNASVVSYDGFGLRVVYDYDINKKTDTISIDMLCGVKTLNSRLAAVIVDTRA